MWGDLKPEHDAARDGGDAAFYDAELVGAVKRFQYRHGLSQDGRVGKNSLAALNVSAEQRVTQILLNMERRRWMPDRFESRYIFVNLADYFLKLVDTINAKERTVFTSEVVVGKPYHETPEFSAQIRYLVINPYWNVPHSIATKELLPSIKADPSYVQTHHYEVLDGWGAGAKVLDPRSIDWSTISPHRFPFRIRQMPGDDNALGRIKFMFPNRHDIYLHDTPSKQLFNRIRRAFSHGCIRVANAQALATMLLSKQPGWSKERIVETINSGKRTVVPLAEPIPIHLAYITAWANKDGSVHFRDDIYGRDSQLMQALAPVTVLPAT